jgi:beta-phosphoglucomutase-like phosphatase (HAD superfamily)
LTELVIFDCDGVLVDSEWISNRVMAEAITEAGLPTTTEDCMRLFMGRRWEDSLGMIEGRLGRRLPADFTETYRARRDAALAAELEPVAGVAEAIARIPVERCVASSGAPEKIRFTLGHTGLLHLFEGRIFSAHEVEHGKPAPACSCTPPGSWAIRPNAARSLRTRSSGSRPPAPRGCARSATPATSTPRRSRRRAPSPSSRWRSSRR